LRKNNPLLRADYFQHAQLEFAPGLRDVFWFDERGFEMQPADWNNTDGRLLGLRRTSLQADGKVAAAIVLSNSDNAKHEFTLPQPCFDFCLMVDTHRPEYFDEPVTNNRVTLAAHSMVVLIGAVALQDIQQCAEKADAAQAQFNEGKGGAGEDNPDEERDAKNNAESDVEENYIEENVEEDTEAGESA
jgi:glycogen operon protein